MQYCQFRIQQNSYIKTTFILSKKCFQTVPDVQVILLFKNIFQVILSTQKVLILFFFFNVHLDTFHVTNYFHCFSPPVKICLFVVFNTLNFIRRRIMKFTILILLWLLSTCVSIAGKKQLSAAFSVNGYIAGEFLIYKLEKGINSACFQRKQMMIYKRQGK